MEEKRKIKITLKTAIIFSILIIAVLSSGICITYKAINNKNSAYNNKSDKDINITFRNIKYITIDDIVVYEDGKNLDETVLKDFHTIAKELKPYYTDTQLVYLNSLGKNYESNIYYFQQISKNVVLDKTYLNIGVSNNGDVSRTYRVSCFQHGEISDYTIKISEEEARNITIDYLKKNKIGFLSGEIECTSELYYYNNEIVWKMNFNVGSSYLMISIDTGKVVDSYFFSGIIVD